MIDNTKTNTDINTKRPLMKEQIVDCGEETQQTNVEIWRRNSTNKCRDRELTEGQKGKILNNE